METQNECLEALAKGGTLTNQYGVKVRLDKFGFQIITGRMGYLRKGVPYSFSSPKYWSIYTEGTKKEFNTTQLLLVVSLALSIGFIVALLQKVGEYEQPMGILQQDNTALEQKIMAQEHQLQMYTATEQGLIELGASSEEAKDVIKAAEVHNVSPKF